MALEQFRPVRDATYYLSEPTLNTPVFEGNGAKLLGLHGQAITPATFLNLFDGYLLSGDNPVKLPKYMHPERRGAFEMTANLPKCASVINQLGEDSRIDEVIDRASRAVARSVEKQARVKVTKKSEIEKSKATMPKGWKSPERKPDNLVWVAFDHPSSRAGEPHRHRHLVFFNLSYDKQEKTWKAVELRYVDQPALGELFRREMMTGLRQLGYKVKASGKEYEIVGVPAEVKAKFSSRNAQIKEIEQEYDDRARKAGKKLMSTEERSKLSLYHRPEKVVAPVEVRRKQWVSDLTKEQFGAVKKLIKNARAAVNFDKWRSSLTRYASKLMRDNQREERTSERAI